MLHKKKIELEFSRNVKTMNRCLEMVYKLHEYTIPNPN